MASHSHLFDLIGAGPPNSSNDNPAQIVISVVLLVGTGIALSYFDGEYKLEEQVCAIMIRVENTDGSWLQRTEHAVASVAHDLGEKIRVGEVYAGRVGAADEDATMQRAYPAGMAL